MTPESGPEADIKVGNALPLANIPTGTLVRVELAGRGGQWSAQLVLPLRLWLRTENYVTLRLPSGEFRMVHEACRATISQVGNIAQGIVWKSWT